MIGIGIRVKGNSKIYYSIFEKNTNDSYVSIDTSHLNVPLALEWPEALNYVRNTILDILLLYKIETAIIRIPEFGGTLTNTMIERIYIEGVLQESLSSSEVEKYNACKIGTLTKLLSLKDKEFKDYAEGKSEFMNGSINWTNLNLEERESVLACIASFNL